MINVLVYHALSARDYHAHEAVSASLLKAVRACPAAVAWRRIHGEPPPSAGIRLGTLAHAAILEPDSYAAAYLVFDGTRRGKAYDAALADAQATGREIVTATEDATAQAMAAAVRAHPLAREWLATGPGTDAHTEVSLLWRAEDGRACKARLDHVDLRARVVCDVKTTSAMAIVPRRFGSQSYDAGTHLQMAWYVDAAALTWPGAPFRARVVAVAQTPPYEVVCYELTEALVAAGRSEAWQAYDRLCECERTGVWPGRWCHSAAAT